MERRGISTRHLSVHARRVHEYGGASFMVHDGIVYFSNYADQRIYRQQPGEAPAPLTPEKAWRFADAIMDAKRQRLVCIREDHTEAPREAVNSIVTVSLKSGQATILVAGNDFYSSPRLSPDGNHLAWLAWSHPNMPWDGCELWVAELDQAGLIVAPQRLAGGVDRVHRSTRVVAGWRLGFCIRSHRLVEPVSMARRKDRIITPDGS